MLPLSCVGCRVLYPLFPQSKNRKKVAQIRELSHVLPFLPATSLQKQLLFVSGASAPAYKGRLRNKSTSSSRKVKCARTDRSTFFTPLRKRYIETGRHTRDILGTSQVRLKIGENVRLDKSK